MLVTVITRAFGAGDHRGQQQAGQREVAQVVRAEIQLEAVGGAPQLRACDAGVVDQQFEPAEPCLQG
jgi:hypothetical protein